MRQNCALLDYTAQLRDYLNQDVPVSVRRDICVTQVLLSAMLYLAQKAPIVHPVLP
jgi:hypothetical protein